MHKKCVRKDMLSELKLISGGLAILPLESLNKLLENLTGKDYDIFEMFVMVRENDGDIINMDMMEKINVECMYTLNTDGTNSKYITISPDSEIKETSRMIMEDEKTMEEYYLSELKRLNVNIVKNMGFLSEKCKENKKIMLETKNEN